MLELFRIFLPTGIICKFEKKLQSFNNEPTNQFSQYQYTSTAAQSVSEKTKLFLYFKNNIDSKRIWTTS
jgi:hypothetical protein